MSFTPFDDTQSKPRQPQPTNSGYDTTSWDVFRQGVEISTNKFRFLGTQPKLWSGNIDGSSDFVTYGQAPSTIDANSIGLESKFNDASNFDPISFVSMGSAYPLPIVFNDGPAQELEAILEPLTIPFRRNTNEGTYHAHAIRGELEDGNNFDSFIALSTNRIEQFSEYSVPINTSFFLDEGPGYFGNISRNPYASGIEKILTAYDDTKCDSARDSGILSLNKKSMSAGYTYYGLNAGQVGTDSIAFGGWGLGS